MPTLLGIPYDANSSFLKGPALAPARIRLMEKEGSANCFAENGVEVKEGTAYHDAGDMAFPDAGSAAAFRLIKETIAAHLEKNEKLLCLGGDHNVSYP
jgi:arginase family enzyme